MKESYYTRRVPLEREMKFSSPEGYVPSQAELALALDGLLVGGAALRVQGGRLKRYRDTYYDTPDDRLAQAGWALRRRVGPASATLGLKGEARSRGALHERSEIEVPETGNNEAAPAWAAEFAAALADERLAGALSSVAPRVVLDVARVSHHLRHEDDATDFLIELCFDDVTCRLPVTEDASTDTLAGTEVRFHEVELEALARVDVRALEVVAEALTSLLPLTPSSVSKAERARALLAPFRRP